MALFPGHLPRFSLPCIPGGKKKQRGLGNCCYGTASAAYEGLPIPKQNCGQAALLQEAAGTGQSPAPQLQKWTQEMESLFHGLLFDEPILGICKAMSEDSLTAFQASMKDFLRQVRSFAPEMKPEDMGQALRNFMVYSIVRE